MVDRIVVRQESDPRYFYHRCEQPQIDNLVYQLYDMSSLDIMEIELWFCRRYPLLARAQGFYGEVEEKYTAHLLRCDRILTKPPGYWRSHPVLSLTALGEGQELEFKESLEWDVDRSRQNKELRTEVLKTICAFLNTNAGKLLIGVSDIGEIKGLDQDFTMCGRNQQNPDGFEQKLRSLIGDRIDPAPLGKVDIQFHELPEGSVCEISVNHSDHIHHLDGEDIYVRDGNRSLKLRGRARTEWIQHRA